MCDNADSPNDELARRVVPELPRLIRQSKGHKLRHARNSRLAGLVCQSRKKLKVMDQMPMFIVAKYGKIPAV